MDEIQAFMLKNFFSRPLSPIPEPLQIVTVGILSHARILNMINTVSNTCCTTVRDVRISLGSDKLGVFTLPSLFDPLGMAYSEPL